MNLWGHCFSHKANQKLQGFLPYQTNKDRSTFFGDFLVIVVTFFGYDPCLFGRAEILVIFGWHFGRNNDLINSLNLTDLLEDRSCTIGKEEKMQCDSKNFFIHYLWGPFSLFIWTYFFQFEMSSLMNWILVYFKLEFYRLQLIEKSSSN
jgi:hypothetical protein